MTRPLFVLALTILVPTAARAEPDDAADLAAHASPARPGCTALAAIARPIAAPQYHDPALQQTAGTLVLQLDRGELQRGTIVATIVGKSPDGSLVGNHDGLLAGLGFRTRNDRIAARPTSDKCVLNVTSQLNVVDGSGALAHRSGTLTATGQVNVCGGEGRVVISGSLCLTK